MIILTKKELVEVVECAFMEFYDIGPMGRNSEDDDKNAELKALSERIMEKATDACLKYPHVEWRHI